MKYQVGELYYHSIQGLVCIIELEEQSISVFDTPALPPAFNDNKRIGKYAKLSDNKEYILYNNHRFSEATDADVIEYLTNKMLDFPVSARTSVSLYADSDLVYLNDNYETIAVHRDDIAGIIEILNREINF